MSSPRRPYDPLKRALDIVASALLLVLLSPLLALTALLVRVRLGSPVLFRQARPGRDGRLFELVKFRTMREAAGTAPLSGPAPGAVAAVATDEARLTPFGRLLRASSLDELPELVNVLRGEMSIVGPRPLLPEYLERYNAHQARRHEVRPGITGLAQVSGRNALSWEERFDLDVRYVDERSLLLDLRILAMTVGAVFSRRGVSAEGHATMEPFTGSPDEGSEAP